jgi:1-acyl-sn-glycerol-3-phosphate acyltransferase
MLYAILKPLTVVFMRLLFGLESWGAEHVPTVGPVLLVANHASVLDPPLVGGAARRPLSFLAKAELFDVPLFGGLIRRLGACPLRREGPDAGALRAALRVLRDGGALLVFPEGTRGQGGVLGPAKPGAGMLAVLGKAPVVPVYVSGSDQAWPRGRRLPRPTKVTVTFGPPFAVMPGAGASRKEDYEAASRQMMAAIADLRDSASPTDLRAAIARDGRRAVGGVGVGGARTSPKYIDGRNRQHEDR